MWVLVPLLLHPPVPASDVLASGEALAAEGRCVACHAPPAALAGRLPLREASRLDDAGARLAPGWVRGYLAGRHLPDVLGADDREAVVEDLVHFLASQGSPLEERDAPPIQEVELGRQLYHSIGCVACHDPFDLPEDLELPLWNFAGGWLEGESPIRATAHSLAHLPEKTTRTALARYLLDPHATRPDGRMPSLSLTETEAERIAAYLTATDVLDGETTFAFEPGLFFREIHGRLDDELASYEGGEAARTGIATHLDELPEHPEDFFGFLFEGFVDVPRDGRWTFATVSDDGSRLYLDGRLLVDNGGEHGPIEREGSVELQAGKHSLKVTQFEHAGGESLSVTWSGPDVEKGPIPPGSLFHLVAASVARAPEPFTPDPARVADGARAYERLGCAACHSLPGHHAPVAPALAELDPEAASGCLAPDAGPGAPRFAWTPDQRAALAALVAGARDGSLLAHVPTPAERLHATLERLDCFACHRRGEEGGPDTSRLPYFRAVSDYDLGDEGRIPPHLDGVGAKLWPAWLARVVRGEETVRPYLVTRMPVFGEEHVAELAELFQEVDLPGPPSDPPPFGPALVEPGRQLASVGNLGCVQCHDLGPYASLGIPAVNLATARDRIQPAWFEKLLLDPRSVGMNSRMPIFWQEGRSPVADVLDGDPVRQTEALWSWLSLGEAMPLPDGLVVPDEEYELIPRERPIQCAVFLKGVGPRAVLVGFPERVHYAFDVGGSRPALAWRGRFYNARGTWHARAGGLEVPPSSDVLELVPGVPFARLATPGDPWPTGRADELGFRARGRRLDADGVPSFRYASETLGLAVEETLRPLVADAEVRLTRTLRLAGPVPDGLWWRVAVADELVPLTRIVESRVRAWRGDGVRHDLRLPPGAEVRTRASAGRRELLVRIPPSVKALELEVTYTW